MTLFEKSFKQAARIALVGAAAIAMIGCGASQNTTTQTATTQQPAATTDDTAQMPATNQQGQEPGMLASHPPMAGTPSGTSVAMKWTAPSTWQEVQPSSSMRKAQYVIPKATGDTEDGECAVFYFGAGQGGSAEANADRWAGQFTAAGGGAPKPTITNETDGGAKVMKVVVEGTYAPGAMMGGPEPSPKPNFMLLGAIAEGHDANWFFKCTGPKATMEANQAAFDGMIASIQTS